jgi:hypothetical protein
MGLLVGVLAVGGLVVLVVGWALHHREQRPAPRIDAGDEAADAPPTRLSA